MCSSDHNHLKLRASILEVESQTNFDGKYWISTHFYVELKIQLSFQSYSICRDLRTKFCTLIASRTLYTDSSFSFFGLPLFDPSISILIASSNHFSSYRRSSLQWSCKRYFSGSISRYLSILNNQSNSFNPQPIYSLHLLPKAHPQRIR